MKYMLDTNICIYLIKKKPISVIKKFTKLAIGDIGISSITLAELMYDVQKSQHLKKNMDALAEFTSPFEIMPFDDLAAKHYGHIRNDSEKKEKPIGPLDLMIAAHAISINTTLVTNNTREFNRVPNLKVEDWV